MRIALAALALLLVVPAAGAKQRATVVIDPGHDLRANSATEPIGPGSSTMKIKDGGGTHGVVSGLREADLNLRVALRLRTLLERTGMRVVMTRTRTAGMSIGNIADRRTTFSRPWNTLSMSSISAMHGVLVCISVHALMSSWLPISARL